MYGFFRWLATRAATKSAIKRALALRTLHPKIGGLVEGDDLIALATAEWKTFAKTYYNETEEEVSPENISDNRREVYLAYLNAFIDAYRPQPSAMKWEPSYAPRME